MLPVLAISSHAIASLCSEHIAVIMWLVCKVLLLITLHLLMCINAVTRATS